MMLERVVFAHRGAPFFRFSGEAVFLTDNLFQMCSSDLHCYSATGVAINWRPNREANPREPSA